MVAQPSPHAFLVQHCVSMAKYLNFANVFCYLVLVTVCNKGSIQM